MQSEDRMTEVIEKRRFLRLRDYFKVSFHETDDFGTAPDDAPPHVGYSKDVSLGGVAFVTTARLDVGQVIAASIAIPEIETPIDFIGEVVRVREIGEGRNELAVKFLPFGLDEDRRSELELFIYDHFLKDPSA